MQRVVTGIALALGMVALVFLASPEVFKLGVGAISVLAAFEFVRMAQRLAPNPAHWLLLFAVPSVLAWQWGVFDLGPQAGFLLLVCLGAFSGLAMLLCSRGGVTGRDPVHAPVAAGLLSFGTAYLGGAAVAMGEIHSLDPWLFFLAVVIVGSSDTAAYYGGKATGRHKLAPAVSPNKTIEGSLWGLTTAVVCVGVYSFVRLGHLDGYLVLAGALTAIAGQFGDLVESLIKRAAGVKDSGTILPGHGGILDRVDALLLATPVMYLALLAFGAQRFVP